MSGRVLVRRIEDSDIEAVVELWRVAGLLRPWNDPLKDIAFARAHDQSTVLVAVEAGQVVGTAMVGHDGHRGWVYYVAAHPERNGQGIGRLLMDAAETWVSDRGVWKVQILVRSDNDRAKGFYERLGYVDTRSTCLQKVIEAGAR